MSRWEENFFEKSQGAPILLIGMGGVGGRIVAQIDKMLAKDSPRRDKVAILAIDTNVKDLRKLREQGIETIQISDERLVRQYLKDHPEIKHGKIRIALPRMRKSDKVPIISTWRSSVVIGDIRLTVDKSVSWNMRISMPPALKLSSRA